MPITVLGGTKLADTTYDIANSVRFNDGDSPSLRRTIPDDASSTGSRVLWTFSTWLKRGVLGTQQAIFGSYQNSNYHTVIEFTTDDQLNFFDEYNGSKNGQRTTERKFRDITAWYHIVCVWDKNNGTDALKMRVFVNGTEESSFGTNSVPSNSGTLGADDQDMSIGERETVGQNFDGYFAETFFIDGTAYAASAFGEFDEDSPLIWKPKDCSGDLTFGTNGFWLDYEDSSNLGNDANGGTDYTEANLAAIDQCTDSPTNNFCTMNPLNDVNVSGHNFTEGNTVVNVASGERASSFATMGMVNGKWYCEMKLTNASGHDFLGIAGKGNASATDQLGWNDYQWSYYSATGKYAHDGSEVSFSGGDNTWGVNDIIGLAIDLDSGTKTLKWHKNGTYQSDVTLDEAASVTDWGAWFFACGSGTGSDDSVYTMNFGNPSFSISSGNADANGYGNFEYAVPSGYYALCTKNLAEYG